LTQAEQYFVHQAVIALAGEIGECRGRRGSEPGWVKCLSAERLRAIHEASHAIVAASVAHYVHRVSIIPDQERRSRRGRYFLGGHCLHSTKSDIDDSAEEEPVLIRDQSQVALAALALTLLHCPKDTPRWIAARRIIRLLKDATVALIERYWPLIIALALELERSKEMDRVAVERYTNRVPAAWMDFPLLSVVEEPEPRKAASAE
jgi:hypothetical protein